jgi:transcriptional regulator with XRE-family HTH domain
LVQVQVRMAGERKLSDDDVARLRHLHDEGWAHTDLAAAFGVTTQHVGRLVRGEQRPLIAGLDAAALHAGSGVSTAVDSFLEDVDLRGEHVVLAATARALSSKLDACGASEAAAAAQAVPRLAGQLVDVLERLREGVPGEPDELDRLRQRRETRLLAMAAR